MWTIQLKEKTLHIERRLGSSLENTCWNDIRLELPLLLTLVSWPTESGGLGTEDLGLHPDQASIHGSRHLRLPGLSLALFVCSVFGVLAW